MRWMVLFALMLGSILEALDTSIVNVAIPTMMGNFGATVDEINWVSTAYMISNVVILPLTGWLSAYFGRRNYLAGSIILFTISSFFCGISTSLNMLILFRVLQGVGGAALLSTAMATLLEIFPPEQQGMVLGVFGIGVMTIPTIGPAIGGWITDNYSWNWIFFINIPIGIINMMLVARFLHDPPYLKREKGKIDFPGLWLLIIGLGALQLMLEKGGQKDWFQSGFIVYLAAVSFIGMALFIWRELVAEKPAVDLRVLKNLPFASGTMLGGILGVGLYGSLFLLPLFLQQLLGYPAFDSGLVLMPRSLAMAVMMPVGGRLYNRLGPKVLIGIGLAITAFSFWQLSNMSLDVGFRDLFVPQSLQGAGFGMIFVALSTAALASIERHRMTDASGLYNVVRQVFGSVGIALTATELTRGENIFRADLVKDVTPFTANAANFVRGMTGAMTRQGNDPATAGYKALNILNNEMTRQASMLSYNHVFFLGTVLFVFCIPLVFFLKGDHGGEEGGIIAD